MASVSAKKGSFLLKAYQGDAKTLLAFNLDKTGAKNLAGFTIQVEPAGKNPYYLLNQLRYEKPGDHAQVAGELPTSSVNAPIHKFRWVHVPGSFHGSTVVYGKYKYSVTPRYFDGKGSMLALDPSLTASVNIAVQPFKKQGLELGFTRGFVQSQAYVNHFGPKAIIRPDTADLLFDTSKKAGKNAKGQSFTWADEYEWLGSTAREKVLSVLNEVVADKSLQVDVFAYDLNEPDVMKLLLKLAPQGRIRIILDNAALHHDSSGSRPEDQFEAKFTAAAKKGSEIRRGKFGRFAHDKIFIVKKAGGAVKLLTGSTNFSITGLYVNSNHVMVFSDPAVAAKYAAVFDQAWNDKVSGAKFAKSEFAGQKYTFASTLTPSMDITFSPHPEAFAKEVLDGIAARVAKEGGKSKKGGSVLFAVMAVTNGTGPVLPALEKLHDDANVFSFGISDSPGGIVLYKPGTPGGLLVSGKPGITQLPKPFSQVPGIGGGHQIHHKFVVCGFNTKDAVVYCGSSNLALGGEQANGDNLIAIHDTDVATAFAIEAVALVDHFNFLDKFAKAPNAPKSAKTDHPPANKTEAAADAGWFLQTNDKWTASYFKAGDLHSADRQMFGSEDVKAAGAGQ